MQILKTKNFNLIYEKGALRQIKSGNTEILRMIYSAVRDHNWGTLEPEILNEEISSDITGFLVKVTVRYKHQDIHFEANYKIQSTNNKLVFEMDGEAKSTFKTNRTGICVLHPINECAGKPCAVFHSDGNTENQVFPEQISPYQPMKNIAGLEWKPSEQLTARLTFHGDIFEMEDQRNWTDASYKTYCRPLDLPFPYEIKKGEKVCQKIELEIDTFAITESIPAETILFKTNNVVTFKLPELGVCNTSRPETLTISEANILKKLPFSHLGAELKLFNLDWKLTLARIAGEANLLNLPLFMVLYFSDNHKAEWNGFENSILKRPVKVSYFLVLGKNHMHDEKTFKEVHSKIKQLFPDAKTGVGVNAYFAELNRNRPNTELSEFISFTICPEVHAFDNLTLVENLEGAKYAVQSAKNLFPGKPVFVSPVTLKQRFNVVATSEEPEPSPGELPYQVDVRQNSVFAAQWLLGSLKFLAQSGAQLATFFETVGWRGFIQGNFEPPVPEKFSAKPGDIFPLYFVLKEISGFEKIIFSESSDPLKVDGLVLQNNREIKVLLANFTPETLPVEILGMSSFTEAKTLFSNEKITGYGKFSLPPEDIVVLTK